MGEVVPAFGPHSPYPTPEAREAEVETFARRAGGELVVYGHSVEGRPLVAVRVPAREGARGRALVTANLHGLEFVGGRVALGVLSALGDDQGPFVTLRRHVEVWVAPCLNPDGYARTFARGGQGSVGELRKNARGVDLNRNFPLPKGAVRSRLPFAGASSPKSVTFRGEAPLSEPETAALAAVLGEVPFHASANLHSLMGTLITPRCPNPGDYASYGKLCRAFREGQGKARYRRLASRVFDGFTGELEDFQHHCHETWAICVEVFPLTASLAQHLVAPSVFWRFNPSNPAPWVANDVGGIAGFFRAAIELGPPAAPLG